MQPKFSSVFLKKWHNWWPCRPQLLPEKKPDSGSRSVFFTWFRLRIRKTNVESCRSRLRHSGSVTTSGRDRDLVKASRAKLHQKVRDQDRDLVKASRPRLHQKVRGQDRDLEVRDRDQDSGLGNLSTVQTLSKISQKCYNRFQAEIFSNFWIFLPGLGYLYLQIVYSRQKTG